MIVKVVFHGCQGLPGRACKWTARTRWLTAPGLVTSLRKARLSALGRRIDVQTLTDVNNMLLKILATPDR